MLITVRSAPPAVPAAQVAEGEKFPCFGSGYLKVRLAAVGSAVGVRPYYERDGRWWPLRADSVVGVGASAVTADPGVRGGLSEGMYAAAGISSYVCLVAETGVPASVAAAYLELVEQQ